MSQVYVWRDERGGWQLGRKVKSVAAPIRAGSYALMRRLYDPPTAECAWVPEEFLVEYPESKIEEPRATK